MTHRDQIIRELEKAAEELDGIGQLEMASLLRRALLRIEGDAEKLEKLRAGIVEIIERGDGKD